MKLSNLFSEGFLEKQDIADKTISGVSIDSRTTEKDSLFVAINGENFDSHDYVNEAIKRGAVAVVASKNIVVPVPVIYVDDTQIELQKMAKFYRSSWKLPVLAVTGSCGKTTTKNILGSILSSKQKTLVTEGNFNNLFGLPLTMFKLTKDHVYSVFEVGASYQGEIKALANILQPNIAVITNAGPSHLENMGGSVAAVAEEKGALFEALPQDGIAIVNLDDRHSDYWLRIIDNRKFIGFSLSGKVSQSKNCLGVVTATNIEVYGKKTQFDIILDDTPVSVEMNLVGTHNLENALAAVAASKAIGVDNNDISKGLKSVKEASGRLTIYGDNKKILIDDSYNANPKSFAAAIDVVSKYKQRKIVIMGDMLELASESNSHHYDIGSLAAREGVDILFCYGEYSKSAVDAFGTNAKWFSTKEQLLKTLQNVLGDSWVVLVKGSRSMGMEYFAERLKGLL